MQIIINTGSIICSRPQAAHEKLLYTIIVQCNLSKMDAKSFTARCP